MQIGVVGLGRMGGNIAQRLMKAGHQCVVSDADAIALEAVARDGAKAVGSLAEVVQALGDKPRVVWVMLPAGKTTEQAVEALGGLQEPDDTIIDGGNSFYKDDIRRARQLAENRIRYVDCGTSGVLTAALYARFRSREQHSFGDKMLSAIRFGFGSHVEGQEPIDPEPEAQEPGRPPGVKHAAE